MSGKTYPRLTRPPGQSLFLLGVRGVGKSTWARRQFPDASHIDLLDEARYQDYLADPSLFAADLQSAPPGSWVVVDEIQRLPNLLNEVHRHIEDRRLNFALLGSSARKLKAAGVNLLAGRALRKIMHPLTPAELGDDFDLEAALDTGTIPLVWVAGERRPVLESYVRLYLREEIRAEGLVRNLPGFARFLPIAALYHGQVVNISGIARDCGVARTTVQGYLDILEDTLLAFRLPAFQPRLRVRERRHPKLYWVDPGLVRAVKKLHGPIAPEERGALLEGWVLHLLRALAPSALPGGGCAPCCRLKTRTALQSETLPVQWPAVDMRPGRALPVAGPGAQALVRRRLSERFVATFAMAPIMVWTPVRPGRRGVRTDRALLLALLSHSSFGTSPIARRDGHGQHHDRNLDDDVKTRLRVRAAEHSRSMEEEVRIILREAVNDGKAGPWDLAKFTRECFAPLGGVELKLPPRGPADRGGRLPDCRHIPLARRHPGDAERAGFRGYGTRCRRSLDGCADLTHAIGALNKASLHGSDNRCAPS